MIIFKSKHFIIIQNDLTDLQNTSPTLGHLSHFGNSNDQVIEGDVAVTTQRIPVSLTHTTVM